MFMKQDKTISVVMCTYNGASRHLREQLDSIFAQTLLPGEIVVQDDCSTDDTMQVLREYADRAPEGVAMRIVQNTAQMGINANFFSAMRRAEGELIAVSDQDDIWMPTKLEKQLMFMQEKDCCMVFTSYITCDELGRNTGVIIAPRRQSLFQTKCDDKIGFLTCIYDTEKTGGKMFMPVQRKRQDYAYVLQILQKCRYAYGIQEPLAYYRLHSESISANKWSLIKYEMLTWRVVFGDSKIHSLLFFIFCFLPSYAWKKLQTWITNRKKNQYLNAIVQ